VKPRIRILTRWLVVGGLTLAALAPAPFARAATAVARTAAR